MKEEILYGEGDSGPIQISGPVEIKADKGLGMAFSKWSKDVYIAWVAGQSFANTNPKSDPNPGAAARNAIMRARELANQIEWSCPDAFLRQ